eukprot:m.206344 g.206344  ORF g.206344 m.206344 type:complete len:148 (-) comp25348_c0_seq1:303-746(-)
MRFANETHAQNPKGAMQFMGGGRAVDVWTIHLAPPLGGPVPLPRSLLSINALLSSGAVLRGNRFNFTTCSARWKSPNSVIVNNTFAFSAPNLEITYLQPWFEGAAVIANITLANNTFHYGVGVDPIHPNPTDTSGIIQQGNRFLGKL